MRKILLVLVLSIVSISVFAQSRTITGTITDGTTGEALIGASVRSLTDASVGALTDIDGNFFLEIDENTTQVVVSYVGYEDQTIELTNNQSDYSSSLTSSNELESVVITSYGKEGQTEITGALSIVKAERIENVPIASFEQILQGQAPGLTVLSGSGQPGTAATVRIRGASSIQGDTAPLYILDGQQLEQNEFAALNPNDFEVAAVLKDASATAQYGSRANNGVIILKTKTGQAGRTRVQFNTQYGFSEPGRQRFDLMNATELLAFQEVAQRGAGWILSPNNPANQGLDVAGLEANATELARLRANDNDFRDVFFRQGQTQSHNLSFRGGNEKTTFFTSLGVYNEEGISIRSDFQRLTGRLNLDHNVSDDFRFSFKLSGGNADQTFIESENGIALANPFAAVYLGNPFETIQDEDGNILYEGNDPNGLNNFAGRVASNAFARLNQDTNDENEFKGTGSVKFEYDFLNDFTIGLFGGIDYTQENRRRVLNPEGFAGGNVLIGNSGSVNDTDRQFRTITVTPTLNYTKSLNSDQHYITAVAGYESIDRTFQQDGFTGFGLDPLFPFPTAINGANFVDPTSGNQVANFNGRFTNSRLQSGFLLGTYTYDNKYEFGASIRQDASSRFGANFREGRFWSGSFAWNLDREGFLANSENISRLKLRASLGTTGNDRFSTGLTTDTGNFPFAPQLIAGNNATNPSLALTVFENDNLKWEESLKANVGVDFEFFNRLRGSLDVYRDNTTDLLLEKAISAIPGGGFEIDLFNAGELRNEGVELEFNTDVLQKNNFSVNLGANLAYNRNEVINLGGEEQFEQGTSIIRVGEEVGAHFVEPWAGVDPATGDPLYFTPDGEVTNNFNLAQPQTGFGSSNPPWIGGFNGTVNWGGFSAFAQFNFAADYVRFNNQNFFLENPNFAQFNQSTLLNEIWTQPGDITEVQRIGTARQFSSKDLENADFLRFRNLNLSYQIPSNWTQSTGFLQNASVFANATNLYTWTEFTGFDPEDSNNIAGFEFPLPRQIVFGINVGL